MKGVNDVINYMIRYDGRSKLEKDYVGNKPIYSFKHPEYMIFYDAYTDTVDVELFTKGGQEYYRNPLGNCVALTSYVLTEEMLTDLVYKYITGYFTNPYGATKYINKKFYNNKAKKVTRRRARR